MKDSHASNTSSENVKHFVFTAGMRGPKMLETNNTPQTHLLAPDRLVAGAGVWDAQGLRNRQR